MHIKEGMAALAELERYIKENETTLHSINQQKLARNSFSQRHDRSFSHSHSSLQSVHRTVHHESSIENELNNFISRLQQIKQFRLSQLQQVNALFALDMEIEDQFDLNVITDKERYLQTAEEEFEAFLLGENKETIATPPNAPKDAASQPFAPPPPQSTLFSNHALANSSHKSSTTTSGKDDSNSAANESKSHEADDAVGFTDDLIIELKNNRLDRSNRLRGIARSIEAIGLTSNTSSNTGSTTVDSRSYSMYRKTGVDLSAASRSAEDSLHRLRRDVLNTSTSSVLKHRPNNVSALELPPPPPPPLENTANKDSVAPLPVGTPAAPAQPESAAITLQSILEDEQFDVSTTDIVSSNSAFAGADYVSSSAHYPGTNIQVDNSDQVAQHPSQAAPAAPSIAAPFLVSNARRRAFEQGLAAEAEEQTNLSISTIHSHPHNIHQHNHSKPYSNNRSTKPHQKPSAASSSHNQHTTECVVGIGFGERYGFDGGAAGAEEAGEISSIGSQESGESGHLSSMRRSGNKLFEYADQLESPVKKKASSGVSFAASASDGRDTIFYGPLSSIDIDSNANDSIQKAAHFTRHVSDYYNRRILNLEAGGGYTGSPKNIRGSVSRSSSVNTVDMTSPVRSHRRASAEFEYTSPTPKTPTFAPIFS